MFLFFPVRPFKGIKTSRKLALGCVVVCFSVPWFTRFLLLSQMNRLAQSVALTQFFSVFAPCSRGPSNLSLNLQDLLSRRGTFVRPIHEPEQVSR